MRRPSPTLTVLALAAALALAGCGSGGGGDSTAASASNPAPSATRAATSDQSAGADSSSNQHKPPPNLPPPTPGTKAAAPGVPTSKEGDNSIQTWGLEASDSQRQAATATVQRYLDARAARNWDTVCHLLAAKPRREQEKFGGGASCARAMASFAADAHTSLLREEAQIEVLSLRAGHRFSFLIYHRPDGIFATALTREGGEWRLISATPNPIE